MNSPAETRAQIDAAIAAEQTGRALSLLKQLWHADPSLASAPFVLDRFAKVPNAPPTVSCKLLVLRSFTVEPLVPLVRAAATYWGVDLQVRLGQFNSYVQEVLDPNSTLYQDPTDVVLLAVQTRDVAPELWSRSTELEASQLDSALEPVVEHVLQARK